MAATDLKVTGEETFCLLALNRLVLPPLFWCPKAGKLGQDVVGSLRHFDREVHFKLYKLQLRAFLSGMIYKKSEF